VLNVQTGLKIPQNETAVKPGSLPGAIASLPKTG
jgi:hypothetical protein